MFEIPLDETLVAYLLEKVDATSEYKAQWTQFLLAGFNTFSDLFDMPVVYMMDSYRETFSQSQKRSDASLAWQSRPDLKNRQHWAERKAAYPLGFSSICPLHLLFDCPHHEAAQSYDGPSKKKVFSVKELSKDLRPDSDTRLRPKGAASKNHFGTQRVRGVKQDPCSDECYLRKKLDVGSSGEVSNYFDLRNPFDAENVVYRPLSRFWRVGQAMIDRHSRCSAVIYMKSKQMHVLTRLCFLERAVQR